MLCSGLILCPFSVILGPILGLWALRDLKRRPDRRGRGIAIVAIILGVAMTIAWMFILQHWNNAVRVPLQEGPRDALIAGLDGRVAEFQAAFDDPNREDHQVEAALFLTQLSDRYGLLLTIVPDTDVPPRPPEDFTPNELVVPYDFHFEEGVIKGEAAFRAFGDVFDLDPRWMWIRIADDDLGDLTYPASAPSTAMPVEPAADPTGDPPGDPGGLDGG